MTPAIWPSTATAAIRAGATAARSRQARMVRQAEAYCRSGSSSTTPGPWRRSWEGSSASARSAPSRPCSAARVPCVPMSIPMTRSALTASSPELEARLEPLAPGRGGERLRGALEGEDAGDDAADGEPAGPQQAQALAVLRQALAGGAGDGDLLVVDDVGVERDDLLPGGEAAEEDHPGVEGRHGEGELLGGGAGGGGDHHVGAAAAGELVHTL